jgi:hypothetical protein
VRWAEAVLIARGHPTALAIGETKLATRSAGGDSGIRWRAHKDSQGFSFFWDFERGIPVFTDGYERKEAASTVFCKYVSRRELQKAIFGNYGFVKQRCGR